jgi:3-hydroxyacyl-CoA dehydrogenase/3a,7a,12a-trihydroxy-5b-cholest-24-enoyl-CoA hydratase
MARPLDFEGRVAVITGAGSGLGSSHALELARRGAHVLVNDLDDVSNNVAVEVANEIRALGSEAAVSNESVEDGARIIEQALDTFGKVDIVINNAGLLRNTSFLKMSEEDWDILYRVHLLGAKRVTKAVWPHMRDARYGRVLMTTSQAGTFGMIGAANYAAMKSGVTALAQTLAIEGETRNIKVNAVAPIATSRLTQAIWTPKIMEAFNPDLAAKAAILLVHERCPATGRVFEIGGGWMSEMRWQQSEGVLFEPGFRCEDVEVRWNDVTRFADGGPGYRAKDYLARIEAVTGEKIPY